jgi:hypothetical protein
MVTSWGRHSRCLDDRRAETNDALRWHALSRAPEILAFGQKVGNQTCVVSDPSLRACHPIRALLRCGRLKPIVSHPTVPNWSPSSKYETSAFCST